MKTGLLHCIVLKTGLLQCGEVSSLLQCGSDVSGLLQCIVLKTSLLQWDRLRRMKAGGGASSIFAKTAILNFPKV